MTKKYIIADGTMYSLIFLYLKGVAMGAADAVPGVSGGTVAFISGIYEELILAIRSFDGRALKCLCQRNFRGFWDHIHGTFLAVLLAGIGTSLLIFSRMVLYWLDHFPVLVWAFFFGLIIASIQVVARKIDDWQPSILGLGLGGGLLGYALTVVVPAETPENLWFVFLSGMIAICAMILPGISGSFILVLLSKYEYIFTALRDFNLMIIAVFGSGCIVGILLFSHLLSWTLRRYHAPTIAMLTGLMMGSLNKIWPWKVVVETFVSSEGEVRPLVEKNILPTAYFDATGTSPYLTEALLLAIAGFSLVYFLEKLSSRASVTAVINRRMERAKG